MRNVRIIAGAQYRQRIRSRTFQFVTVLGVLVLAGLVATPALLSKIQSLSQAKVVVVDPAGTLAPRLEAALPARLLNGEQATVVHRADTWEDAVSGVDRGRYAAAVEFALPHGDGRMYAKERSSQLGLLRAAVTSAAIQDRLAAIPAVDAATIFRPANLAETGFGGDRGRPSVVVIMGFLLLLYMSLMQYGSYIASSVAGEKGLRITEVISTAVKPGEHMAGKLLGLGLVGLTQYAIWVAVGGVALWVSGRVGDVSIDSSGVTVRTLLLFAAFFLVGYALYAALFAALGSLVNRAEEAAQVTSPLNITIILGYLIAIAAASDPTSQLAKTTSWIPPFTPLVMLARALAGSPSLWQLVGALSLSAATAAVLTVVASRIYRAGLLLYGQKPSFSSITRLIRAR